MTEFQFNSPSGAHSESNTNPILPICENCGKTFKGNNVSTKPLREGLENISLCPECYNSIPDIQFAVSIVKWFLIVIFGALGLATFLSITVYNYY